MKGSEFVSLNKESSNNLELGNLLKQDENLRIRLEGLKGSQDARVAAGAFADNKKKTHLFILHDREEAAYFQNDLSNFSGKSTVLFFPTSYKKPYQYEEIDNANVLERAEALSFLNENTSFGNLIVTYPEALSEKVINKKSLVKNTFNLRVGDSLDTQFISELLLEYGFEKADFVYEAGQFALRGGIVDVFSFSNELPYRIELLGDEVESIRTFDPDSQLSRESKKSIAVVPDIQTKLIEEKRESLLSFLPPSLTIWIKDVDSCYESIDLSFSRCKEEFDTIMQNSGDTTIVCEPEELFTNLAEFKGLLDKRPVVEFGHKMAFKPDHEITYRSEAQPSFNKQVEQLVESLRSQRDQGYELFIASDSPRMINNVRQMVEEHDPELDLLELNMALRSGYIDKDNKTLVYTDHQIFERYHKFKTKERHSKSKALTLKELKTLKPGDFVTHIDHGVGRFAGMEKKDVNGVTQESIRLIYKDDDILYVNVHSLHKIAKHSGQDGQAPSISKLGSPEWENKKKKVRKRVKELAFNLINLYAKRKSAKGFGFSEDTYLQVELENSFLYEDTPDQAKATNDVKADMEQVMPMDRLVCGDVGFGKTEIAVRAAFKAVADSKQVAILVPTTILAMQHHKTFAQRLKNLPCRVDYLNRFRTTKETTQIVKDTKEGKIDILIGTHKLVSKQLEFKNLALLIIDEEQKFGVGVKDKLKDLRHSIDVLTLTATPIPRTLQFSLMGARDLSVITTPPPNRQPVTTEVHTFNEAVIRDAIQFELKRGGQVFFVHNRIKDIESVANIILKLVPDSRIGVAHGQMDGKLLEKTMLKFIDHEFDVLISTNIIESGLDIPNANTIIINNSHMYGLSDLHQMRGRVGRSNKKAFCYLLTPQIAGLSSDARKRLRTLEEFSDLGDGYKIAMRDLDLRGAGDLLGGEQSGFINDIGFETYHQILDETVQELKETVFKDLFATSVDTEALRVDCNIETDKAVLIPDDYVSNISERLRLYNELDVIKEPEALSQFVESLQDRFGPMPSEVQDLIQTVELRWEAEQLGFEKASFKGGTLRGYVTVEGNDNYFQSEVFGKILRFIQTNPNTCTMKELKGRMTLSFKGLADITAAKKRLAEAREGQS